MRFSTTTIIASSLILGNGLAAPLNDHTETTTHSLAARSRSHMVPRTFTSPSTGKEHKVWVYEDRADSSSDSTYSKRKGPPLGVLLDGWAGKDSSQVYCKHEKNNVQDTTSEDSPPRESCKAIEEFLSTKNGQWNLKWDKFTPGKYRSLVESDDDKCSFAVTHEAMMVRLGDWDIRKLILQSEKYTKKFGNTERLSTEGTADCDGDMVQNGSAELKWRLGSLDNLEE
jgi:hypothetical protein